jgi:hemerythrin-like domain-containing protein
MKTLALHPTTRIIQQEHQRLGAIIHAMLHFVRGIGQGDNPPPFKVFRAMLLYIADYPEKMHHPKEDGLFVLLQNRTGTVDDTIAALEDQHAQGEALVRNLEHQLTRYELQGGGAADAFFKAVEDYAVFYFGHMRMEEEIILPAIDRFLTTPDWEKADLAFAANEDSAENDSFEQLFSMIANITPAPIGLGTPVASRADRAASRPHRA